MLNVFGRPFLVFGAVFETRRYSAGPQAHPVGERC